MKKLKLLIIPLLIMMLLAFGMNSFASLHSKWSSGDLIYYDGATDIFAIKNGTDGLLVYDDLNLTFGDDADATIVYDETTDNKLEITCSNGITLSGGLGYTGDILMATTSKIQFHDTGLYINANGNGAMVISSDGTLAVGATTSYTLTSPAVKFVAITSVIHEYDAASYVTQTIDNAGVVLVSVTGDSTGTYEIATDDGSITLDSASTILLESTTGITATGDISASDAAGPQFVDEAATTTNPTLCPDKAEDDTGLGWASDTIHVVLGGADEYSFSTTTLDINANTITESGKITADDAAGFALVDEAATATNPTICPDRAEEDTGLGWESDTIHIVLGGTDEYDFSTAALEMNANNLTEVGTISVDDTTDASSLTAGAVVIDGGLAVAKQLFIGDDIDMSVSGTGVYELTLKTHMADALSITDGTDIMVFETTTGTPVVTITPITTIVGAITSSGGIVVADDMNVAFGTGSDITMDWDNTKGALVTAPLGHYVSPEGISDRYRLVWVAGQRGKPCANGDIQDAAESTRMIADSDFEVLGTAGSSDDITYYAEGGITIETDGTDGNGVYICPHLDANQSPWAQVTWGTDKEVRWEAHIRTGAAITTCIIYAGLKLTATDVVITDNDQVFFRYEDGINDGEWQAVNSIADSDDSHDTNVVVAINTDYHFVIEIDSSRVAKFYINGSLVETSAALTDTTDFIPYISIEEDGASAAMTLYVKGQAISRKY